MLVVQSVVFESQVCNAHPIYYSLVHRYHHAFCLVLHWLAEDVVCIDLDCYHYVPVATL